MFIHLSSHSSKKYLLRIYYLLFSEMICAWHWEKGQSVRTVAVVQSLHRVRLFVTPWTAACQASLSFTISWNLLKFMSIESMMPSNHFILCLPLLLLPSLFSSIRVFSNESAISFLFFLRPGKFFWHLLCVIQRGKRLGDCGSRFRLALVHSNYIGRGPSLVGCGMWDKFGERPQYVNKTCQFSKIPNHKTSHLGS